MNDTDQYRRLQPKVLPDATMFALPGGRWIAAQLVEELGSWEVVYFGHLWAQLLDFGLTRIEAELLAHGERQLRLAEEDRTCTCPRDPDDEDDPGDPLSTCPVHGWTVERR